MANSKRTYHQSEINMFLKCAKQWYFRYVDELRIKPKSALTLGISVHKGVETDLKHKIETEELCSLEEIQSTVSDEMEKRKDETEWDDDFGSSKDVAVQLATVHHKIAAPKINPLAVELKLEADFEDKPYRLAGTIDCVEKDSTIVDAKTSSRKYEETAIERAIQPAVYNILMEFNTGEEPKAFRYDVLIKPTARKPAEYQSVQSEVTRDDQRWLFNAVDNIDKQINAGAFPPAPEGAWWCSKGWCGYWDMCKGKKS